MQTTFDIANEIFQQVFGYKPFSQTVTHIYEPECEETPFYEANIPAVKQVIFNKDATIVYFVDGSKCVVHKSDKDEYNREHAVVYAIVKRAYGVVDPKTGLVSGNGMGAMLEKLVKNGFDQEAHKKAEQQKKAETVEPWPIPKDRYLTPEEECEACEEEDCPKRLVPYKKPVRQQKREEAVKAPARDSKGRFAKKANRNK